MVADLGQERLAAWFLSGISAAAWLLAVLAVFGLVGYVAESRRRDFGVMLALGASVRQVAGQALATLIGPVAIGVCAGLVATFILGRGVESFLLGVSSSDARTYVVGALLFLLCATAAGAIATLRLRRLSPAEVMRG